MVLVGGVGCGLAAREMVAARRSVPSFQSQGRAGFKKTAGCVVVVGGRCCLLLCIPASVLVVVPDVCITQWPAEGASNTGLIQHRRAGSAVGSTFQRRLSGDQGPDLKLSQPYGTNIVTSGILHLPRGPGRAAFHVISTNSRSLQCACVPWVRLNHASMKVPCLSARVTTTVSPFPQVQSVLTTTYDR